MNRRKFSRNVKVAVCVLVTLVLIAAIVYISIRYWYFFNSPGWSKPSGGVRVRIEGGNMWYLLCLWVFGGAIAFSPLALARIIVSEGLVVEHAIIAGDSMKPGSAKALEVAAYIIAHPDKKDVVFQAEAAS
ncbi:MAG: hypothetical protein GX936_02915 [Clostridiales bacterium]|jgi:hypothetical protein|nr:hypothetical protein [Clostridiales bacterium]